jgi:hypothetical protein
MTKPNKRALGVVLGAVVFFGIGFLLRDFVASRNTSASNACVNNLRQLDSAQQQWALENNKTTNDLPNWEALNPYFRDGQRLVCPQGGTYRLSRVGDHPKCSLGPPQHALQ